MRKKSVLAAVLSVLLLFAFAGCGSSDKPATLEEYFNENPDQKAELVDSITGQDGQGVLTMDCEISGNTFTVIGTMTETYPEETLDILKDSLEGQADSLKSQMGPAKKSMAETTGISIDDIIVKVVYCNGDGTEIWSTNF